MFSIRPWSPARFKRWSDKVCSFLAGGEQQAAVALCSRWRRWICILTKRQSLKHTGAHVTGWRSDLCCRTQTLWRRLTFFLFFFYSFSSVALIPSLQYEDLHMKYYFNESPLRDRSHQLTCESARLFI